MTMRKIEIDFDVHQKIEAARMSFDDPPNAALRRLLGLGSPKQAPSGNDATERVPDKIAERPNAEWRSKGVVLPDGTELLVDYSEVRASGRVVGGRLSINGELFRTPSAAVMSAVEAARGSAVSAINGWKYLYARLPGEDEWTRMSNFRKDAGFGRKIKPVSLDDFD